MSVQSALFQRGWGHRSLSLDASLSSGPLAAPVCGELAALDGNTLAWLKSLPAKTTEPSYEDNAVTFPFKPCMRAPRGSRTAAAAAAGLSAAATIDSTSSTPIALAVVAPANSGCLPPSAPPSTPSDDPIETAVSARPVGGPSLADDDPFDGKVCYRWRQWSFTRKGELCIFWTHSHLHPITQQPLQPFRAFELSLGSNGWIKYTEVKKEGTQISLEHKIMWFRGDSSQQDFSWAPWHSDHEGAFTRTINVDDGPALEAVLQTLTQKVEEGRLPSRMRIESFDPLRGFIICQNDQCRVAFAHNGEARLLNGPLAPLRSFVEPLSTPEQIAMRKERTLYVDPRLQYRWGPWAFVRTASSLVVFRHDKLNSPASSAKATTTGASAGAGSTNPFGPAPTSSSAASRSTSTNPFDPSFKPSSTPPASAATASGASSARNKTGPLFRRGLPTTGFRACEYHVSSSGWIRTAVIGQGGKVESFRMLPGSDRKEASPFTWQPCCASAAEAQADAEKASEDEQRAADGNESDGDNPSSSSSSSSRDLWRVIRRVTTRELTELVLPQLLQGTLTFVPYASSRGVVLAQGGHNGCHSYLAFDGIASFGSDGKALDASRATPGIHPPYFPHEPPEIWKRNMEMDAAEDSGRFGDLLSRKVKTPNVAVMQRLFPFPEPTAAAPPAVNARLTSAALQPQPSAPPAPLAAAAGAGSEAANALAPSAPPALPTSSSRAESPDPSTPSPSRLVLVSSEMLASGSESSNSLPVCGICYEEVETGKVLLTPCGCSQGSNHASGHFFCLDCLSNWIRTRILIPRYQKSRPNADPLVDPVAAASAAVPKATFDQMLAASQPNAGSSVLALRPEDQLSCPTCRQEFALRDLALLQHGLPFTSLDELLEARNQSLLVPSALDLQKGLYSRLSMPSSALQLCAAFGLEKSLDFLLSKAAGGGSTDDVAVCGTFIEEARPAAWFSSLPSMQEGGWQKLWANLQEDHDKKKQRKAFTKASVPVAEEDAEDCLEAAAEWKAPAPVPKPTAASVLVANAPTATPVQSPAALVPTARPVAATPAAPAAGSGAAAVPSPPPSRAVSPSSASRCLQILTGMTTPLTASVLLDSDDLLDAVQTLLKTLEEGKTIRRYLSEEAQGKEKATELVALLGKCLAAQPSNARLVKLVGKAIGLLTAHHPD
jgi:hypothetical protein